MHIAGTYTRNSDAAMLSDTPTVYGQICRATNRITTTSRKMKEAKGMFG